MYHNPVMLHEAIEGLNVNPQGVYVDVTYGGGGHSKNIISQLNKKGRLIAFDQDIDALSNVIIDDRITLLPHNFRYLTNFLRYEKALPVDGILADLGVSSHQFDKAERGFSTRFNCELDMRMNQEQEFSTQHILNEYPVDQLAQVFREYGEIPNGKHLANLIVGFRKEKRIVTTNDLKSAIAGAIDKKNEAKFMAKVFQALRIETNDEIAVLKEFLCQSLSSLKPGGRLVVISYHSLEDRLVKNFMKAGNWDGSIETDLFGNSNTPFQVISKKAITPSDKEIGENSRARSAKLRIAEKR